MQITVTINGVERAADVEPRLLLVYLIREVFGLTGTHVGCDTTNCGSCTVLLDGVPVKSCTMFGVQADGRAVTTVEAVEVAVYEVTEVGYVRAPAKRRDLGGCEGESVGGHWCRLHWRP